MSDERDRGPGGPEGPEPTGSAPDAPSETPESPSEAPAAAEGEERPEEAAAGGDEPPPDPEAEAAAKAKEEAAARAKAEAAAKAKAAAEARAAAEAAKPPWEKMPETPEPQDAADEPLVRSLSERHGEAIGAATLRAGELAIEVEREAIRRVATSLKEEHGYRLIVDLCGVHDPGREEAPYGVVYHVYSLDANRRVRLTVALAEGEAVPSVVPVWKGADWLEREAWDMFGISFEDHPDMTRILLWEGFNGHPLRKDFPVEGIDTGAAIYPEYYEEEAGPVAGTGTGWKPPKPPEPPAPEPPAGGGDEPAAEAEGEA